MFRLFVVIFVLTGMTACTSADFEKIARDSMSAAAGTTISSITGNTSGNAASAPQSSRTGSNSYSVGRRNFSTVSATRSQSDYGKVVVVKTEKNPQSQTKLALNSCKQPNVGPMRCGGYLFEVTEEGWLVEDPIHFDDLNNPVITLAAGTYYIKFKNWKGGQKYFTSGELTVTPFVTNIVDIELE
ncbi:hypothetical protein M0G74_12020 [Microbulbifer sp. CAU 1566]|uniref:hypothetical protein n=1 Tax=Microbulbifer sp. CAU 1566 TaxID=2933269 RepID=UPI002003F029|nr:hypothetical protein [Microbulbifer sp. CAU 1566]MCK7598000.1 hypothetical protein [Microbulbifer sp. CAU 1566]